MQSQFLIAGLGDPLRAANDLTGNVVDDQRTLIEDGECTEVVAAHDGQNLLFYIEFVTVADDAVEEGSPETSSEEAVVEVSSEELADGTILIDRVTRDCSAYDVHETVTIDELHSFSWSAGDRLLGFYRVRNETGVPCRVWHNNAII